MTDNVLFISIYLGLVIGAIIKGLPKNPIDNFLAHISSHKRQKRIAAADRLFIVQLVQDSNLFIMETRKWLH